MTVSEHVPSLLLSSQAANACTDGCDMGSCSAWAKSRISALIRTRVSTSLRVKFCGDVTIYLLLSLFRLLFLITLHLLAGRGGRLSHAASIQYIVRWREEGCVGRDVEGSGRYCCWHLLAGTKGNQRTSVRMEASWPVFEPNTFRIKF
jgi:hypothetical protein